MTDRLLCHWSSPKRLLSDNGMHFVNAKVNGLCAARGIEFVHGLPYHSQTQGLIERFNATLYDMIKKHVSADQKDWDVQLPWQLWSYNTSVHSSTGLSPFQVLRGVPPPAPAAALERPSAVQGPAHVVAESVRAGVHAASETVSSALAETAARAKSQYDRDRRDVTFAVGDSVMLFTPHPRKGLSPKFQSLWSGPHRVLAAVNDINYRIQLDSKEAVVPVSRLKKHVPRSVTLPSGDLSSWLLEDEAALSADVAADAAGPALVAPAPAAADVPAAEVNPAAVVEPVHAAVPAAGEVPAAPVPPLDPYIPGHVYEIDSLLDRQAKGRGHSYLVRWSGFGPEFDEWRPRSALPRTLVDAFDHDHPLPVKAAPAPPAQGTRVSPRLHGHPHKQS